ncbi:MAG: ubiquinone/menaquinone biosynthesis methyltransferase [Deltaproteobacteria bacterium]|jgi:demethylmenaquinone methyltransferase/2-methoxy-6-polyprenyl-1,4-benzoquinol methylase|nr:ubiquinone/menaquinone biosynthesis methyltransferase [Deltaproteobacteria bacterium]
MPEPETYPGQRPDIKSMFSEISERYDALNRFMSLGRDRFWRDCLSRRLLVLGAPGRFLDLATGTGDQILSIKKFQKGSEVTGLDFSGAMLALAQKKLRVASAEGSLGDPMPTLVRGDALTPPLPAGSFDSVTISFGLRNIAEKKALYASILRLLRPGGRFLALEVFFDPRSLLAPIHLWHLKTVIPFMAGQIFQSSGEAYAYLCDSVVDFPHPHRVIDDLLAAGFVNPGFRAYTFGGAAIIWCHKPPDA